MQPGRKPQGPENLSGREGKSSWRYKPQHELALLILRKTGMPRDKFGGQIHVFSLKTCKARVNSHARLQQKSKMKLFQSGTAPLFRIIRHGHESRSTPRLLR